MTGFSEITWITIAAVGAFGLVQVLRALAIGVRNETMIHDLRVRVVELQIGQFHAQMLRQGVPTKDAEHEAPESNAPAPADRSDAPALATNEAAPDRTAAEPAAQADERIAA